MGKFQLGPWRFDNRDITLMLWILATHDAEGRLDQPGALTDVRLAYVDLIRKGYHLRDDEHFTKVLRDVGSCDFSFKPVKTIWGVVLYTPKGIRQYHSFLERMDAGNPPTSIGEFYDRVANPARVDLTKIEDIVKLAPKLHLWIPTGNCLRHNPSVTSAVDWSKSGFGPGSFSEKVQRLSASKITKLFRWKILLTDHKAAAQVLHVPKTYKSDRIITKTSLHDQIGAVPLYNALITAIEKQSGHRINFTDQEHSRRKCDINHDTLDFSAASDRNLCTHVQAVTDPRTFQVIMTLRTKIMQFDVKDKIYLPSDASLILRDYEMFATMGCVLTFPVMTWTIYSLTIGFMKYMGATKAELNEVVVFGDDLLVPHTWGYAVARFFNSIGFVVNTDKSFYEADCLFRETCGEETYDNESIKPLRVARGSNLGWWSSLSPFQLADFITTCNDRQLFNLAKLLVDELVKYDGSKETSIYYRVASVKDKEGRKRYEVDANWVSALQQMGVNDVDASINLQSKRSLLRKGVSFEELPPGNTHVLRAFRLDDGRRIKRFSRTSKFCTVEVSPDQIRHFGYRRMFKRFWQIKSSMQQPLYSTSSDQREYLKTKVSYLEKYLVTQLESSNDIQDVRSLLDQKFRIESLNWLLETYISAPMDVIPTDSEIEISNHKKGWLK
jgi:hypothetical protein